MIIKHFYTLIYTSRIRCF